jgi:hypothetical protein
MNWIFDPEALAAWTKTFLYSLFAAFGGVMGHLMRTIDKQEKIVWGRAALEGCAAGFVGFLTFFLCEALKLSPQWTGVIVGVFGWLGANATIRLLEGIVMQKLGLATKRQDDKEAKDDSVAEVDSKEP